ncbi:VOC family protein [Thermobifida halotolerans]|uniref:VOC family protein n=1 Tax=Thermobifida halotolerans TaxID=483545 RepID=A0A399G369_9ACTN|nr:VOC family protein [Thermobifida halotolerans]UOE19908.1 VOC family protein [Thermobifida halotolerans]
MENTIAYASGAPAWLDMTVPDLPAAQRFYAAVLGWEFDEGPYRMALLGSRRIAGMAEPWDDAPPPEQSNWTVYLATGDIGATLTAVRAAGGTVVTDRTDIPGAGSMALVRDPAGTVCGLWQGDGLPGSEISGVPGAPVWAEVTSPDSATADFFATVFGLTAERLPGIDFTTLSNDGEPVFGVYGADDRVHRGHGAWLPYFLVDSTDKASLLAEHAGGAVLRAPADSPYGRWAMLTDHLGAHFAVVQPVD